MSKFSSLFLSSITLLLCACSGGGGGGGDSSSSNNKNLPKTGVRVINGSIDAPPFDVLVAGGTTSLPEAKFAGTTGYTSAAAGSLGVIIKRANSEEVIAQPTVQIDEAQRKSVLFAGDYRDGSSQSFELNDNPGELKSGFAKVRIINAVQGLRGIEASVGVGAGKIISLGSATDYVEVPAGVVSFTASSQLGGIANGSVTVEEKMPYSILVTGEWGYFITTSLLLG